VSVRLLVRGICALRPGVKGLSENIQVRSVVGRFLEHSRIYHFENDGAPNVFIGSGDWMERNLRERVEATIPIKDPSFIRQLEDILSLYWADNSKVRIMRADGSYTRPSTYSPEAAPQGSGAAGLATAALHYAAINAQEWLARHAETPDLPLPDFPRPFRHRSMPSNLAPFRLEEGLAGDAAGPASAFPYVSGATGSSGPL
jgi:hypothetical protein